MVAKSLPDFKYIKKRKKYTKKLNNDLIVKNKKEISNRLSNFYSKNWYIGLGYII